MVYYHILSKLDLEERRKERERDACIGFRKIISTFIQWANGTNLFIHVLELLGFNGRVNLANLTRINPCRHGLICRSPWLAKITSWFCPISILLPNMDTDFLIRFKIWKILTAFDGPSCKKSQFSKVRVF